MPTGVVATTRARSRARVVAPLLGGLAGLFVLTAAVTAVRVGWSATDALDAFVPTNAAMGLGFAGCGVILAWHRPANPLGWVFLAAGLLQSVASAMPPLSSLAQEQGATEPVLRLLATAFVWSWPWAIGLCIPVALLLFPDGRPVSPRWRPVVVVAVAAGCSFVVMMAGSPLPPDDGGAVAYLTLPAYDRLGPLWQVSGLATMAVYLLAMASLAVRYRRSEETVRRQLLWLLLALAVVIMAFVLWGQVAGTSVAVLFAVPLIPLAVTVAVVRHQLLDIRVVVSRALSWLILSLAVVVAYAVLVALLDRFVSDRLGRSAVPTVLLVLLATLVLPRLQRLVDRAMYGDRANPTRLVTALGAHLAGSDPGLTEVVGSVRQALRLPYLAVERDGVLVAVAGEPPDRLETVPLTYAGSPLGALTVGLRTGERRLARADERALRVLAVPLSLALHTTAVSAELQTSRVQLVSAREDERRRLRRDLHDGLGPALTGIAFTADAAANRAGDPQRQAELLDALRRDTRAALTDVRRVVDELRPPALDELGLVGALQERAAQLGWRADGAPVRVRLDVPSRLPVLPAAVEVAAYRIATEAMTNIARHSTASSAVVRLRFGDRLEVLVRDDGPAADDWTPGVGLQTMRERVAELGGAFSAGPSAGGGQVHAWLPLVTR